MYKKTITYVDYNGTERKEDHYFNLNKAEITRMELSITGGLTKYIERIIAAQDAPSLIAIFEDLIQKSYGIKTPDGKGFMKKPEYLEAFMATEAYSELFMELAFNAESAAAFVKGIIPSDLADKVELTAAN